MVMEECNGLYSSQAQFRPVLVSWFSDTPKVFKYLTVQESFQEHSLDTIILLKQGVLSKVLLA